MSRPVSRIAFDLGLATGYAFEAHDGRRMSGHWNNAPKGADYPCDRVKRFYAHAEDKVVALRKACHSAALIVTVERPIHHRSARDGQAWGVWYGQLLRLQGEVGFSIAEVDPSSWASHAGVRGRGDERKACSMRRAAELGWRPETHDEAEACLILEWAIANADVEVSR